MAQYQRELERQQRAEERAQLQAVREAERAQRAYERARAAEEKEQRRLYVESRVAEVEARNAELEQLVERLEGLLAATLDVDDFLDFEVLKVTPDVPFFQPGGLAERTPEPDEASFMPPEPSFLHRLLPGAKAKHELAVDAAKAAYA